MIALHFVCERGGMVDALSSGGSECILVRVQVPPFALFLNVVKSTFLAILAPRNILMCIILPAIPQLKCARIVEILRKLNENV